MDGRRRDVPIITFNPLRERGLERFVNPQSPSEMLTPESTLISTQYHQVAIGGDTAAITGIAKALLEMDDCATERGTPAVLDYDFIATHTEGFEAFTTYVRDCTWAQLEHKSGLTRGALEAAARQLNTMANAICLIIRFSSEVAVNSPSLADFCTQSLKTGGRLAATAANHSARTAPPLPSSASCEARCSCSELGC